MGYGFCIKDNPVDTVAMRMGRPPLSPEKQALRSKIASTKDWQDVFFLSKIVGAPNQSKLLSSISISSSDPQATSTSKMEKSSESPAQETVLESLVLSSHWPQYLLDLLRVYIATPPEEKMIEKHTGWVCARTELLVASQLKFALKVKLAGIQPILKTPVTVNAQMADIYRQGQRNIMEEHLKFLESFLENYQVEKRITLREIMVQDSRFKDVIYDHLQEETLQAVLDMGQEIIDAIFTLSVLNNFLIYRDNKSPALSSEWWQSWFSEVNNSGWWPYHATDLAEDDTEELESQFEDCDEVEELSEFRDNWIVPLCQAGLFGDRKVSEIPLSLINWTIEVYDLHRVQIGEEIFLVRV